VTPFSASIQFLESISLGLIAATGVLGWFAVRLYRGQITTGRGRVSGLFLLRVLSILLLLVLLLDPVLSLFSERSVPARIAVLLDGSLSMSIPVAADTDEEVAADRDAGEDRDDAGSRPTRASRVFEALGGEGGGLLADLAGRGRVDIYRFGASVVPLPSNPSAEETSPTDDRTDLARALVEGVGARRRETGAVVLLTDGSQNVGIDPREEARRLGVPVYAIGVGQEGTVTDLSIVDVEASGVAYLDNDVPVLTRVRARGDAAGEMVVYLSEGSVPIDSARVDLPGGGTEEEIELRYVPTEEGLHRYRIWTPTLDGEISEGNNEHLFAVRVLKEKIRVLLVAGRPSFDLTFLKRALESDVSLTIDPVVLSLQEFPGTLGRRGIRFPESWAELAPYDLVILLDVGKTSLSDERFSMIARFAQERGGALLVMGSTRSFDLAGTDLEPLLPVAAGPGPRARTGQILPGLTGIGRAHPVTRMEGDPEENIRVWRDLPPLGAAPVFLMNGRPDSRVLVQGVLDGVPRPELPLVVTSGAGRARVLAVAGTPYWRWDLYLWGSGRSGDFFRRFISRAVRWLVSRDELEQVMIRPGKSLFDGAEDIVVEGQVYDDDFRPVEGADVRATVSGPLGSEEEKTRELSLVDLGAGRYRGVVPGLPPGDFRIEGSARVGGVAFGEDRSEMTVAPYRMEFENPVPDLELLREIARESGGRFLPLDEVGELARILDLEPVLDRSVRELPFLENPLFFLALLALLGVEWGFRRRRGLP
jgi:hypothetical protein